MRRLTVHAVNATRSIMVPTSGTSTLVLKLILRRAMLLAVVGVGIGVLGAVAVTRYLTALLYGVKPFDAITFAGVALGLILVALLAAVLPARRASKVDPLVALRYE